MVDVKPGTTIPDVAPEDKENITNCYVGLLSSLRQPPTQDSPWNATSIRKPLEYDALRWGKNAELSLDACGKDQPLATKEVSRARYASNGRNLRPG